MTREPDTSRADPADDARRVLGVVPNCLKAVGGLPRVMRAMWAQIRDGYLDHPLPWDLKQRICIDLARHAGSEYWLARHVACLITGGPAVSPEISQRAVARAIGWLSRPLVTAPRAERVLGELKTHSPLASAGGDPDHLLAHLLSSASVVLYISAAESKLPGHTPQFPRWLRSALQKELQRVLGRPNYHLLCELMVTMQALYAWVDVLDLEWDEDVREVLDGQPRLAKAMQPALPREGGEVVDSGASTHGPFSAGSEGGGVGVAILDADEWRVRQCDSRFAQFCHREPPSVVGSRLDELLDAERLEDFRYSRKIFGVFERLHSVDRF